MLTAVLFQLTETEIAKKLKNNHQLTETETEITNKTETETEKSISVNWKMSKSEKTVKTKNALC